MRTLLIIALLGLSTVGAFSQKNSIEAYSRTEIWNKNYSDRYYQYLQYGRHNEKRDLFVRLTSLQRNPKLGFITDVDLYPKYKKGYAYINVGYSPNTDLFPKFRNGAELYRSIGKKSELSLGYRHIHIATTEKYNIWSVTGTYGYYFGDYYAYVRPTLTILKNDIGSNFSGVIRRYFDKNYLEVLLSQGFDGGVVRKTGAIESSFGLKSYMVRFKFNYNLNETLSLFVAYDHSGILISEKNGYARINSIDVALKMKF